VHKVSVLIATYDRPLDLACCLEAISRQQPGEYALEVCVVNDGGTDIDPVVRQFPGLSIHYTNLDSNVGQVEARNIALEMATGDLIAICDDDDRWLPTHVQNLVQCLDRVGSEAALAYGDAEIVLLERGLFGVCLCERTPFAWKEADALLRAYNPIVPSAVMYRRSLHEDIGNFDPSVSHYWDWDFFLRARAVGRLVRSAVADTLYAFFRDGSNQSADASGMAEALRVFTDKHGLGELPVSNFYRMLRDPALAAHRDATELVWDGDPSLWRVSPAVE
jgi:glycosyltransferase involved in cell wall biosynthesis